MEFTKEETKKENKIEYSLFTLLKIIIVLLGLLIVHYNTISGLFLVNTQIDSLKDKSFELTSSINSFLSENTLYRHILIGFSSFLVDALIIYASINWCLFSKSYKLIVCLFLFYSLRSFIQVI